MKKTEIICQRVRYRAIALMIFASAVTVFFIFPHMPSTASGASQQGRAQQGRQRRLTPTKRVTAERDYSSFKHEDHRKDTNGKKLACSECHAIASPEEPDRIVAATLHKSASGFPYHDSCWRCHRTTPPQVFRGDRPVICTVCHTRVGPKITPRDVYSHFPGPKHDNSETRELPAYFPHGLHLSLAVWDRRPKPNGVTMWAFSQVSFIETVPDNTALGLACASCHSTDGRGMAAPASRAGQVQEAFRKVEPDTLMTVPGEKGTSAHASCFNCHWKTQKPTKDDCEGCHLTRRDEAEIKLKTYRPPALSPDAAKWFEDWPAELPKRFTLKFRHNTHSLSEDGKTESNAHGGNCATCHINITRVRPSNAPEPDVEIITCASCHSAQHSIPNDKGEKLSISDEVEKREKLGKSYTCVACHTSAVGSEKTPCTHYFVIGKQCPK